MGLVVTGIAQSPDISVLETALSAAGFSLEHIQIVAPGDEDSPIAPRGIMSSGMLGGGLETGTGVPGLSSRSTPGGSGSIFFRSEDYADRLGDFEIPDDEVENYIDALDAGRVVVAYFARPETIDAVEGVFRTAGLAKVKRF